MRKILLLLCLLPAAAFAQSTQPTVAFQTSGAFIALSVEDLEASTNWYVEKLGLRVVKRPPPHEGTTVAILEGGGLIVELIDHPAAKSLNAAANISHNFLVHGIFKSGIIVTNYDAVLATLRERGIPIAMGPFPAQDGLRANFIIRDNSGNFLQFFGPL